MLKKFLKAIGIIAAVAVVVTIAVFVNAFVGNPISKHIAANTAEKHLNEKYSDRDFEIERVFYNFKDEYYYAYIKSPSSTDTHFTLLIDMWGYLCVDNYESDVLTGWNTAIRIGNEYRNMVDKILNSSSFPYVVDIGFGDIETVSMEFINDPYTSEYALIMEELTIDKKYDINELASKAGKLTIYIDDKTVSYERMAEIILNIKKIFDDADIKFYALDFVLEYPKDENGIKKEGRVEVRDFLYTYIFEEGMVERVKKSDAAANAYYAEKDNEKSNKAD